MLKIEESAKAYTAKYWDGVVSHINTDKNIIIIAGEGYYVGDEKSVSFRGYGGRSFRIKRLDTGEVFTTTNLWLNGEVPSEYRAQLPDNAVFIAWNIEKQCWEE